jgi:hypothetical protein
MKTKYRKATAMTAVLTLVLAMTTQHASAATKTTLSTSGTVTVNGTLPRDYGLE